LLAFAFGFLLRLQVLIYTEVDFIPHGDAAKYLLYAYNLKNFHIYSQSDLRLYPHDSNADIVQQNIKPNALVTPGYPVFLSMFLGGTYTEKQFASIKLAQVILSSITIVLAYFVFAGIGSFYGLVAAWLTAMSPQLVNMNLYLVTEPLFCFLLLGFLFLLSRIRENSGILLFLVTGLLLGLAVLTRPWAQGFVLILAFYMLVSQLKIKITKPLFLMLGFLLPVAPWLIRNYLQFGYLSDPTLTVTSIHHGMYPYMMYELHPETLGYAYKADPKAVEIAHSLAAILHELKLRYLENPFLYLKWYLAGKIYTVFSWGMLASASDVFLYKVSKSPYFYMPHFYITRYYMEQAHQILVLLSLTGAVMCWLPNRLLRLSQNGLFIARSISLLIFYFIILHVIGAPFPRYSIPLRPIIYGMSLFPVLSGVKIGQALLRTRKRQLAPGKKT